MSLSRLTGFDREEVESVRENTVPKFPGDIHDSNQLLDYIVLVFSGAFYSELAFKGGYMLNKLLLDQSRRTRDVDLSIRDKTSYEQVKRVLKSIAEQLTSQGIIDDYRIKEEITATKAGGIDLYRNGSKVLGVDVSLHDISYGVQQYALGFTDVMAFEVERMLADKIVAILSKKRFRRTKDLYDMYALAKTFAFDYNKLAKYIELRGNAEWDNIPFDETVLIEYERAWERLDLRSSVTGDSLAKPAFVEVIRVFNSIAVAIKEGAAFSRWSTLSMSWVR